MKTKNYLLGLALLMLASLLMRFSGGHAPSAADGTQSAVARQSGQHKAPRATIPRVAVPAASRMPFAPAGPTLPRMEATPSVADLLMWLGRCDENQRNTAIQEFVTGCDLTKLEEMLADESSGVALPEDLAQAILRRVAREDGPWIGDFLQTMPAGIFRGELLGTAMVEWGRNDLPAALEWAQNLKDFAMQETALVHLSYRWSEENLEEALAYAALNPTGHRQLMTTLVGHWSRRQPEAAAAWAVEFAADPAIAGVAASAVAAWAQKDDLSAAEFVLRLPDGPLRQEAAISVMSALARHDPGTGELWMAAFPAGSNRDYAIENLVYNWAISDPNSALSWANRLAGPERDTAIFAGAGGLIESNPALAARWVMSIQDEGRRFQQSERVALRWLQTDRWSAEAWIRSSTLPEQTKTRLLASAGSDS